MVYSMNISKLLDPLLPDGYWGNMCVPVYVALTALPYTEYRWVAILAEVGQPHHVQHPHREAHPADHLLCDPHLQSQVGAWEDRRSTKKGEEVKNRRVETK